MGKPNLEKAIEHINAMTICDEGQKQHIRAALAELMGEELPQKAEGKIEAGAIVRERTNYVDRTVIWSRGKHTLTEQVTPPPEDDDGDVSLYWADTDRLKITTPATVEVNDTVQHEDGTIGLICDVSLAPEYTVALGEYDDINECPECDDWSRDEFTILFKGPKGE